MPNPAHVLTAFALAAHAFPVIFAVFVTIIGVPVLAFFAAFKRITCTPAAFLFL